MIKRSGRHRHGPIVERPALVMMGGRPVSGLIVHADNGQDAVLLVTSLRDADDLVSAVVAMRAELKVAIDANRTGQAA
ncbi:hypothetical protein [Acrocarpospora phusangensis]|nr:hypothetical protein [Acrocarpospora phusangensis]